MVDRLINDRDTGSLRWDKTDKRELLPLFFLCCLSLEENRFDLYFSKYDLEWDNSVVLIGENEYRAEIVENLYKSDYNFLRYPKLCRQR